MVLPIALGALGGAAARAIGGMAAKTGVQRLANAGAVQAIGGMAGKAGEQVVGYGKRAMGAALSPEMLAGTAVSMAPMIAMQAAYMSSQPSVDTNIPPDAYAGQQLQAQTMGIPDAPPPGFASGVAMQSQQSGGGMYMAADAASTAPPQVDPETIARERKRLQRQSELNAFYDSALGQLRDKQRMDGV